MSRHWIALRLSHLGVLALAICFVQAGFAKKKPPSHPINLNTASSGELQLVPGIGPSTADKILAMRKSYGTFKSVDDLLAIKGMGPKKLEKMRKYLVAGKAPPSKKPVAPAQAVPGQSKVATGKDQPGKAAVIKKSPAEPKVSEDEEP